MVSIFFFYSYCVFLVPTTNVQDMVRKISIQSTFYGSDEAVTILENVNETNWIFFLFSISYLISPLLIYMTHLYCLSYLISLRFANMRPKLTLVIRCSNWLRVWTISIVWIITAIRTHYNCWDTVYSRLLCFSVYHYMCWTVFSSSH